MAEGETKVKEQLKTVEATVNNSSNTTAETASTSKRTNKRNKSQRNWQQKKKPPPHPIKRPNDIYITNKSNFKVR